MGASFCVRVNPVPPCPRIASWLLVAAFATSSPAAGECIRSCKADTARCIAERCQDVHGSARRACRETCQGIGGCASIRTLAYVNTVCRTDTSGKSAIRKRSRSTRNCAPVTVLDLPPGPPLASPSVACKLYGDAAAGVMSSWPRHSSASS
jgi:hypothetical protein